MSGKGTCYQCDADATTDEHVPARCFFPAAKDLPEHGDLRRNLKTVPSCEAHNGDCSKDDEYVALMVVMSASNGPLAAEYFWKQKTRGLVRKPALKKALEASMIPVLLDGRETVQVPLDRPRFDGVMTRIARGLYFKETGGKKLRRTLTVQSPAFLPPAGSVTFRTTQRDYPDDIPVKVIGDERIFSYALRADPFFLHMKFYEGVDIFMEAVNDALS